MGVARLDEIGEGEVLRRRVRAADGTEREILLTRAGERVVAYANRCPHMGLPLERSDGRVLRKRNHIFCAHHFATFDAATGACVWGPCAGRALEPVAVEVTGDAVELAERDGEPAAA